MKTFIKILVLLIVALQLTDVMAADVRSPFQNLTITQKDMDKAVAIAVKWLELLDNQKYKKAYALLDKQVKFELTEEIWCKVREERYKTYGKIKSRNKLSTEYMDEIIGFKEGGDYIKIQFETTFENYKEAFYEIIIMSAENNEWKPNSYHIITLSTIKFKKLQSYFTVKQNEKTAVSKLSQKDMDRLLGTWQGKAVNSYKTLAFRFEMSKNDEFTGYFLVPGAKELPITDMGMRDGSFVCTIKPILAEFKGKLTDKKIVGELISEIYPDASLTLKKVE